MTAADLGQRLPAPGTGDELDELGRAFNDLLDRLQRGVRPAQRSLRPAAPLRRRCLAPAPHARCGPARPGPGRAPPRPLDRRNTGGSSDRVQRRGHPAAADRRIAAPAGPARKAIRPEPAVSISRTGCPTTSRRWASTRGPRTCGSRSRRRAVRACEVHPALLAQLVDNLLENACKYSEPGTPIVVRAWRERGIGCPGCGETAAAGWRPRTCPAFSSPSSAENRRSATGIAGVGLGLAVAQQIATAFGGIARSPE